MNASFRLVGDALIGADWATWTGLLGAAVVGDPMVAYQLVNGWPVGEWPSESSQRVYLALSAEGRPEYVGQTRDELARRMAGHRSTGRSGTWAWVVAATLPKATAQELDAAELAARQFFLFGAALTNRRHPRDRVTA